MASAATLDFLADGATAVLIASKSNKLCGGGGSMLRCGGITSVGGAFGGTDGFGLAYGCGLATTAFRTNGGGPSDGGSNGGGAPDDENVG